MLDAIHQGLLRWAAWPAIAVLFALFMLCTVGFNWRASQLGVQNPPPDTRTKRYSSQELGNLFETWGPEGRRLYVVTQLSIDLLFPLVYGLLLAFLIVQTYSDAWGRWLWLVPLILMAFDYAENITAILLVTQYRTGQVPSASGVWALFSFTQMKMMLFSMATLLALIGGLSGGRPAVMSSAEQPIATGTPPAAP